MQPVIKWTGSKRMQAEEIISYMPKEINTYYEPFIGGGSVLLKLLEINDCSNNIKIKKYICSDINKELISIYNIIKENPDKLIKIYTEHYNNISSLLTESERAEYYKSVRKTYNSLNKDNELRPYLFYWILRTCFNGLVRFSKSGQFNTSYHHSRLGITPEKLEPIIKECNRLFNKFNVQFICEDYKTVLENASKDDFIYMDPPYSHSSGMYFYNRFNDEDYFNFLSTLNCKYMFSYDGKSGNKILTVTDIPENIYKQHKYIESGYSSFKKISKLDEALLQDSLYLNY